MSQLDKVIANIDYKLLQQQKQSLIDLLDMEEVMPVWEQLEGLISLIDSVQDAVVEDGIETEENVFGKSNEN